MPKLKLARDGSLAVPERGPHGTEAACVGAIQAAGFLWIPTKAEARTFVGAPAHVNGTLDGVAMRPIGRAWAGVFFAEFKARLARTGKQHLKDQTTMAEWLRWQGYLVYQAPEGYKGDMVRHFTDWLKENFR